MNMDKAVEIWEKANGWKDTKVKPLEHFDGYLLSGVNIELNQQTEVKIGGLTFEHLCEAKNPKEFCKFLRKNLSGLWVEEISLLEENVREAEKRMLKLADAMKIMPDKDQIILTFAETTQELADYQKSKRKRFSEYDKSGNFVQYLDALPDEVK